MNWNRLAGALCTSFALLAGCVETAEEESLGEATQDLYIRNTTTPWPLYARIPLCFAFESGALSVPVNQRAAVSAFVKERINATWGAVLPFDLAYRDCPTSGTSRDVMIDMFWQDGGGRCALGTDGLTTPAERAVGPEAARGCHISIPPDWNASSDRRRYSQRVILHEIGHMLGFTHEFWRPDAAGHPCGNPDAAPGGLLLGEYDEDSIMLSTYECRYPDQFWLSAADVTNSQVLYGIRNPPTAVKDIVWQSTDGTASIFRMSGTVMAREDFIPDTTGLDYKIIGSGDFDGDGVGDLLFRRWNGAVLVWMLNADGTRKDTGYMPLSTEYVFQGIGRFNGDNDSDVIWRSTQTGTLVTWMMNGGVVAYTRENAIPDQAWQVRAVGDFNRDGRADLFWRNSNNTTAVWLMNDGALLQGTLTPGTADATWTVKAAGDFNGDGKTDIFWQNADGRTSMWFMNGVSLGGYGSPRSVTPGWQVQVAADVDADGKSDLLWRKTDGSTGLWVMDGISIRLDVPLPFAPTSWNMVGAASGTINPSF